MTIDMNEMLLIEILTANVIIRFVRTFSSILTTFFNTKTKAQISCLLLDNTLRPLNMLQKNIVFTRGSMKKYSHAQQNQDLIFCSTFFSTHLIVMGYVCSCQITQSKSFFLGSKKRKVIFLHVKYMDLVRENTQIIVCRLTILLSLKSTFLFVRKNSEKELNSFKNVKLVIETQKPHGLHFLYTN